MGAIYKYLSLLPPPPRGGLTTSAAFCAAGPNPPRRTAHAHRSAPSPRHAGIGSAGGAGRPYRECFALVLGLRCCLDSVSFVGGEELSVTEEHVTKI